MNLFWTALTVSRDPSIYYWFDMMKSTAYFCHDLLSAIDTLRLFSCMWSSFRGYGSSFFEILWPSFRVTNSSIYSKVCLIEDSFKAAQSRILKRILSLFYCIFLAAPLFAPIAFRLSLLSVPSGKS
jgi:hypothetical protein